MRHPPFEESGSGRLLPPSADLYSLGVVLYEMLVGRPPFGPLGADTTPLAVAMRHIRAFPMPPCSLDPSLPPELGVITLALLQKSPEDRYGSARALALDLLRFLDGEQPLVVRAVAVPVPAPASAPASAGPGRRRSRARARRRRRVVALAFLIVATASGAAATGLVADEGATWVPSWVPPLPDALRRVADAGRPAPVPRVLVPHPISQLDGRPAVDLTGSGDSPGALGAATHPAADGPGTSSAARRSEGRTPDGGTTGETAPIGGAWQAPSGGTGPARSVGTRIYREPPQEPAVQPEKAPEQTFAEEPPARPETGP